MVPEPQSDCVDSTPVFIVGMPRSGTTLIEQMLDGHPEIHGAGERGELQMIAQHMRNHEVDESALTTLANTYLERIRPLAPQATFITDKMPNNFLYLGEAAQLFPRARVIHCVRDPADTGLSCLFQNFKETLDWAHRQDDIVHFTRDYRRLMDHWAMNGKMRMQTVPYEALVRQPEEWVRRILAFSGSALPQCRDASRTEQSNRPNRLSRPGSTTNQHRKHRSIFRLQRPHWRTLSASRRIVSMCGACDRKDDGRNQNA